MALQHHEFELWIRDAERLQLFFQVGMAEQELHSASVKKAELEEARESAERAARAEVERDTSCHEVAMAKLVTEGVVNNRAQIKSELARVQRALALTEEARRRAELERGAA